MSDLRLFSDTLPHSANGMKWAGPVTCGVIGVVLLFTLSKTIGRDLDFQDCDFGAYYRGGQAVARGETPYRLDEYGPTAAFVYSPAFAYSFRAFCSLEYLWAARIWMLLNWAFIAGNLVLVFRLAYGPESRERWTWPIVWLTIAATCSYWWNNICPGQAGALMVLFCMAWAVCRSERRPFVGGMFLAAGIAVKLAPGILVPYLIVRRDWRGLGGVVAGTFLLFALPALCVGWDGSMRLHREWLQFCATTQIPAQTIRSQNQSLLGLLARLPGVSNGVFCFSAERLHDIERIYPIVVLALAGAVYGLIGWRLRRTRAESLSPDALRDRDNLHLSWLLILMTLAHPRAWTSNFGAVALPCLMMVRTAFHAEGRRRLVPIAALMAVIAACASWHPEVRSFRWSPLVWLGQGKDFWALSFLAAACTWVARSEAVAESAGEGAIAGSISPLEVEAPRRVAA